MKGKRELETTRHMKNRVNFEIYRVWDASSSHFPSQRRFLVKRRDVTNTDITGNGRETGKT